MSQQKTATVTAQSGDGVTIVTQTRVLPGKETAFAAWQETTSEVIARFPGYLSQSIIPPSPPSQVDWVIVQRFADTKSALGWLHSNERIDRVTQAQPMLVGHDDVHLVRDGVTGGVLPSPVSAVISTRIKPGQEAAYRAWELRMAAVQSQAPGFQGYRFEPPMPGVQEDYLSILRFDTEEHLNGWLQSPERAAMLKDAAVFTAEFHARIVRTGFDQWFPSSGKDGPAPAAWKQNMLVLLMLYPVVFLFGVCVQNPILIGLAKLPFAVALFIGNFVGVLLLNKLVPWVSGVFGWWLKPGADASDHDWKGTAIVVGLYVVLIAAFTTYMAMGK